MSAINNPKHLIKVQNLRSDNKKSSEESDSISVIMKLRSRIHKILDEQFNNVSEKLKLQSNVSKLRNKTSTSQKEISINESLLEQWVQMFKNEILQIKDRKLMDLGKRQSEKIVQGMTKLQFPRPLILEDLKALWHINDNTLNFFEPQKLSQINRFRQRDQKSLLNNFWKQNSFDFPSGVLKAFSSVTYIKQRNELILIGGSKPTNPNIKSSKILSFNLKTTGLTTLVKLPYGLSSHSSVYHQESNSIYIIGGNRNHSIVTRGCFRVDLANLKVDEISCLNYPVSSATCVKWKHNWIYKFGGVGDAFGEWNTSPYIERYSISSNQWEVVNPSIPFSVNSQAKMNNLFLAHSRSYVCEGQDEIFVFGGYSIQGEFKNNAFVLKIHSQIQNGSVDNDSIEVHKIQRYGTIDSVTQESFRNSRNLVFVENSQKEVFMFGLKKQNEHETELTPSLVHRFDATSA